MSVNQLTTTERHQSPLLVPWPDGVIGQLWLPGIARSIGQARGFVRLVAETWDAGHVAENAELCVSELATNAHQHATPDESFSFVLFVGCKGGRLRCEVHDRSPDMPFVREADGLDESGRGLFLVQTIADAYGAYPTPRGKAVWFELNAWPIYKAP